MIEAKKALDLVQNKLFSWLEAFIMLLPNMALAAVIVVGFWLLARVIRSVANKIVIRFFKAAPCSACSAGSCMSR